MAQEDPCSSLQEDYCRHTESGLGSSAALSIIRRALTVCIGGALLLEQSADSQDAVHKGVSAAPQHLVLLQPMRASAQNASVQIAHKEDRLHMHTGESTASLDLPQHCAEFLRAHSCRSRPQSRHNRIS